MKNKIQPVLALIAAMAIALLYGCLCAMVSQLDRTLAVKGTDGDAEHSRHLALSVEKENPYAGVLSEEDAAMVSEAALAVQAEEPRVSSLKDAGGNQVTRLGGYTFVEEPGTSLEPLMHRLVSWALDGDPRQYEFFTDGMTYRSTKAEDGGQTVRVDVQSRTVTFFVREDTDELDPAEALSAMRYAAVMDAARGRPDDFSDTYPEASKEQPAIEENVLAGIRPTSAFLPSP